MKTFLMWLSPLFVLIVLISIVGFLVIVPLSVFHYRPAYDRDIEKIWYLTSEILESYELRHDFYVENEFKNDLRPALIENYPLTLTETYPCSSEFIDCSKLSSLRLAILRAQIFYNFKKEDIFLAQNQLTIDDLADELIFELSLASLNPNTQTDADKELVSEAFKLLTLVENR